MSKLKCTAPVKGHRNDKNGSVNCPVHGGKNVNASIVLPELVIEDVFVEPSARDIVDDLIVSVFADDVGVLNPGYGFVSVSDFSDPVKADNMCWRFCQQFTDWRASKGDFDVDIIGVTSAHGNHFAVYVEDPTGDSDDLVVDFTMRQFDTDSDFPYVRPVSEWEIKVKEELGKLGADSFNVQIDHIDNLDDDFVS